MLKPSAILHKLIAYGLLFGRAFSVPPSIFYYYAGSQEEVAKWQPFHLQNRIGEHTIWRRGHCNSKMMHSNLLFIEQFLVECCKAITLASQLIRVQEKHFQIMGNKGILLKCANEAKS